MKPTIAILGLDDAGTQFAHSLPGHSHRLLLFDRDSSKALTLVDQLCQADPLAEVEAIDCQVNACWEADMIILAVPESTKRAIADRIRQVATCKIVVSLSIASRDTHQATYADVHTSEELQQWIPHSKVVNTLIVNQLTAIQKPADAYLSSHHAEALATVSTLMQAVGLTPVVVEDWSI